MAAIPSSLGLDVTELLGSDVSDLVELVAVDPVAESDFDGWTEFEFDPKAAESVETGLVSESESLRVLRAS
jgi:hypothetical protein